MMLLFLWKWYGFENLDIEYALKVVALQRIKKLTFFLMLGNKYSSLDHAIVINYNKGVEKDKHQAFNEHGSKRTKKCNFSRGR